LREWRTGAGEAPIPQDLARAVPGNPTPDDPIIGDRQGDLMTRLVWALT
jgi:hypothetical protein